MTSRGIRNNNPGNIRHSRVAWQGEADQQLDADLVTFAGPEWGLRAIAKTLLTYQARGLDTVAEMIGRWAPPSENDTAAYAADVARRLGVKADQALDITKPDLLARLVAAIVRHENGAQPYAAATIASAVQLALSRRA